MKALFFQKESPRQGSAENVLQGHRTNTPKSNDDGQATRQPRSKALSVSFQDETIPLNVKNRPPSWKNNWTEKHLGLRLVLKWRESANRKITNEILPSSALQSKT